MAMIKVDSNVNQRVFSRKRIPARLSELLSQRLNAYAMAAGAAGVAALACATPAEAAPVCKTLSAGLTHTSSFPLYLIDPAVAPFNIAQGTNSTFRSSTTGRGTLMWWNRGFFTPNSAGAKVLLSNALPADLASGAEIGPGGKLGKGASYGLLFTYGRGEFSFRGGGTTLKHRGNLNLTQNNYVGFQFDNSGAVHYGWARLSVSYQKVGGKVRHTVIHVLGYGYESTPDTAIAAGNCSGSEQSNATIDNSSTGPSRNASLGELALGNAGLARWRRPLL
jgi:hypothetical protein